MLAGTAAADKYRADQVGTGDKKQPSRSISTSGSASAPSPSPSSSPVAKDGTAEVDGVEPKDLELGEKDERTDRLQWGDNSTDVGKISSLPSDIPVVVVADEEEEEVDIEVDVDEYARLLNELNEHSAEKVDIFVTTWNAVSTALVFYYLMLVPFRLGFQFDPYTEAHNLSGPELFLDLA